MMRNSNFIFITNQRGDFFSVSQEPASRFHGLFVKTAYGLFRIFDAIESEEKLAPRGDITLSGNTLVRHTAQRSEQYSFNSDVFVVEYGNKQSIKILFDPRPIFQYPTFERTVEVVKSNAEGIEMRVAIFARETTIRCKIQLSPLEGCLLSNIINTDQWREKSYEYDSRRASPPFKLYLFTGLAFQAKGFKIRVVQKENIEKGKEQIAYRNANISSGILHDRTSVKQMIGKVTLGKLENSLLRLVTQRNGSIEFIAGMPWFFDSWARDEAVSLPSIFQLLSSNDRNNFVYERVERIRRGGFLPQKLSSFEEKSRASLNDGTLFFWANLWRVLLSKPYFLSHYLTLYCHNVFLRWLRSEVKRFSNPHSELIQIDSENQWMDSLQERVGSVLEIEVAFAQLLKYGFIITGDRFWAEQFKTRKKLIDRHFLKTNILLDRADEPNGPTRVNIFLAYYFGASIFPPSQWFQFFQKVLPELWLPWGGLATLGTRDAHFHARHTGENPVSYHQGDSWFFINNIAALALNDFPQFREEAQRLLRASLRDFTETHNCTGASELSDAIEFNPGGSPDQLWSLATLYEALMTII